MYRNNIIARIFIQKDDVEKIISDYKTISSFSILEIRKLENIYEQIKAQKPLIEEINDGKISKPLNIEQVLKERNEQRLSFFKKHPYFECKLFCEEIEKILNNQNVTFENNYRKGRESINIVNILKNNDYLVFIYNRSINSTQSDVEFSGVPIDLINVISDFSFLKPLLPIVSHNFYIEKEIMSGDSELGVDNYNIYYFKIKS